MDNASTMNDQRREPQWMAASALRTEQARQESGDACAFAPLRWTDAAMGHQPEQTHLPDADPFGGKYDGFANLPREARLAAVELARVRQTLGVTAAAFDPLRNLQMVYGRPVQVVPHVMFFFLSVNQAVH